MENRWKKRTNMLYKSSIVRHLQTVLQCCLKKKNKQLIGGWKRNIYAWKYFFAMAEMVLKFAVGSFDN